ncbi:Gfo/Idh/MocA family oxidoreductase, partial [Armatimonas sp.]|uniref:Gfo/Idh/MocA family protein n=1 Tax=Armatimonas sp. TaxID=1872638 RepID=UPI00286A7CCF
YGNQDCKQYIDMMELLARPDIDAVLIATGDNWHSGVSVLAARAGKDIYCEKPISHNIREAVAMVNAQKRHKRVVQVGTWQRSSKEFTDAINYIRSGKFGKVVHCRAWIADGTKIGKQSPIAVPSNLDYDAWIGPAKMVPYQQNKVHWNWRWVMNTGGGLTTDWGVHMMDIALLGMSKGLDLPMPTRVTATGGMWAIKDDDRDAPDSIEALLTYDDPQFMMTWSVLRDTPGKQGHCTEFVNADGNTLRVWRGGWQILDRSGKEMPKESSEAVPTDHWRNFLDCLKSREKPRADLASVAQTTITCHMVNVALESQEVIRWDAKANDLAGSNGRGTLAYVRPYRAPHVLPMNG